jgi:putative intracellular protease/amidase
MAESDSNSPPTKFGLILYPQFEVLDVFGPIEALNVISRPQFTAPQSTKSLAIPLRLSIIASSLNPVPAMEYDYPRPQFQETFNPTHTFETAPDDIEVLIVPGGMGNGGDDAPAFIKERFKNLRYLITVCTGADIAARAGVLDGCRATTNKKAWVSRLPLHPSVMYVYVCECAWR